MSARANISGVLLGVGVGVAGLSGLEVQHWLQVLFVIAGATIISAGLRVSTMPVIRVFCVVALAMCLVMGYVRFTSGLRHGFASDYASDQRD